MDIKLLGKLRKIVCALRAKLSINRTATSKYYSTERSGLVEEGLLVGLSDNNKPSPIGGHMLHIPSY